MPVFNYKVRDKYGNLKTGVIDVSTEEKAGELLAEKGVFPVSIKPKESFSPQALFRTYSKISLKQLMIFSKQFSVMINAGLPIVDSLRTLADEEINVKFAEIIAQSAKDVEGGESLSQALAKYPDTFSTIYVNMIKAGEASGKLDVVLLKLAEQLEKDYELRTKIKGAMIYPAFILTTLIAVSILMVSFVIPRLKPILEGAGVKLPLLTQVLIFSSELFIHWWWALIPGIFVAGFFLRIYFKSPRGGDIWAFIKINIPLASPIIKKVYMARFARTLTTLISGGIGVVEALEITADAVGNIHYKRDILKITQEVRNGSSLINAFKNTKKFPRIIKQMVKVGEGTGTLDTSMGKMADFFEGEVENNINNLSRILEPVLIVVMGILVALMVSSVIMPLYDATRSVGKQ